MCFDLAEERNHSLRATGNKLHVYDGVQYSLPSVSQSRQQSSRCQLGSSSVDEQICIPHHCVNSFLAETVDRLPELAILCLLLKKGSSP